MSSTSMMQNLLSKAEREAEVPDPNLPSRSSGSQAQPDPTVAMYQALAQKQLPIWVETGDAESIDRYAVELTKAGYDVPSVMESALKSPNRPQTVMRGMTTGRQPLGPVSLPGMEQGMDYPGTTSRNQAIENSYAQEANQYESLAQARSFTGDRMAAQQVLYGKSAGDIDDPALQDAWIKQFGQKVASGANPNQAAIETTTALNGFTPRAQKNLLTRSDSAQSKVESNKYFFSRITDPGFNSEIAGALKTSGIDPTDANIRKMAALVAAQDSLKQFGQAPEGTADIISAATGNDLFDIAKATTKAGLTAEATAKGKISGEFDMANKSLFLQAQEQLQKDALATQAMTPGQQETAMKDLAVMDTMVKVRDLMAKFAGYGSTTDIFKVPTGKAEFLRQFKDTWTNTDDPARAALRAEMGKLIEGLYNKIGMAFRASEAARWDPIIPSMDKSPVTALAQLDSILDETKSKLNTQKSFWEGTKTRVGPEITSLIDQAAGMETFSDVFLEGQVPAGRSKQLPTHDREGKPITANIEANTFSKMREIAGTDFEAVKSAASQLKPGQGGLIDDESGLEFYKDRNGVLKFRKGAK